MKNNIFSSRRIKNILWAVLSFSLFLAGWHIVSILIPKGMLTGPLEAIPYFIKSLYVKIGPYTLIGHYLWSLSRVFIGFCLGAIIGISFGLTTGWFPYIRAIIKPIFDILRPIAPLAWIPLAILWFGIEEKSKYFLIFISTVVPFALNTFDSVCKTDLRLIGAARMLGASEGQLFRKIVLPSTIPGIFAGAQVALSSGWMTMLAAEMIRSSYGIGWIIIAGQQSNNIPQMIAGMISIGIVGLILATLMRAFERRALRWKEN